MNKDVRKSVFRFALLAAALALLLLIAAACALDPACCNRSARRTCRNRSCGWRNRSAAASCGWRAWKNR